MNSKIEVLIFSIFEKILESKRSFMQISKMKKKEEKGLLFNWQEISNHKYW